MEIHLVDNLLGILFNIIFPVKILLKIYSLIILMVDIFWIMMNTVYAVSQSAIQLLNPPPLKSVKKETVLVVGSGTGVGRQVAIQMAELGSIVLCVDINTENNDETIEIIKRNGGSAAGYICDVTKKVNVFDLADAVKKELGFISIIFYCCGIPSPRSLLTEPPQNIRNTLDLSLTGYLWILAQFVPEMKTKKHGHIVVLTSVTGLSYVKNQLPLSVAQFATQGLAESLMEDFRINKIEGVRVSLIHIYPFIVEAKSIDSNWKIPSYFGTMSPEKAASCIIEIVRRNYQEASVPRNMLYLGHLLRILPRRSTVLIRDLLDTGVNYGL